MMRSWAYNRFGVLMGTSWPASYPHWHGVREVSWPMITLFHSQGGFKATAMIERMKPSIHMEKMLEDIRNASRLHETIAGISLPEQHFLELRRHLETRQELANVLDQRSLDISKIVETSRLTDEIARQ